MAFSDPISTLERKENHYSKREVDELEEQKVNFKSLPNKEKSYLCILPVVSKMEDLFTIYYTSRKNIISKIRRLVRR